MKSPFTQLGVNRNDGMRNPIRLYGLMVALITSSLSVEAVRPYRVTIL